MKRLIPKFGEARLQSRGDPFTTLARSITGQQISVKAAQSVWERLVEVVGPSAGGLKPAALGACSVECLRTAGLSQRKAEYLLDLARHCAAGLVHVTSWTTRPSLPSWWRSAASAAGPPRCS
jgi:DNA-3-methyladenine glycosylase II